MRNVLLLLLIISSNAFADIYYGEANIADDQFNGPATSISIEILMDSGTGKIHFKFSGSSTRWFALSFGGISYNCGGISCMTGYSLIVHQGGIKEYDLNPFPELHSSQGLTNASYTDLSGIFTAKVERLINTGDPEDWVPTADEQIAVIWGEGESNSMYDSTLEKHNYASTAYLFKMYHIVEPLSLEASYKGTLLENYINSQ